MEYYKYRNTTTPTLRVIYAWKLELALEKKNMVCGPAHKMGGFGFKSLDLFKNRPNQFRAGGHGPACSFLFF